MDNISDNIRYLRGSKGWSQQDLADALLVGRTVIANWERGANAPPINHIISICDLFGISIDDFILKSLQKESGYDTEKSGCANTVQSTPNSTASQGNSVHLIPVFSPQNSDFPRTHEDFNNSNILVPAKAYAGYSAGWPDDLEEGDIQAVVIPGIRGAARTVEVSGESMLPILEPGDWVVCRPIEHHREIKDGKIYVVVSSHYGLHIKYLHLYEKGINCISENRATHDSFILPFDDIREIWEVVLRITTHLRPAGAPVSAYESDRSRIRKIETWLSKNFPDFNQHLNDL